MDYKIGTDDPIIHPDPGAGPWNSEPKTLTARAEMGEMLQFMPEARLLTGPHAVENLLHYFDNTGTPQKIDVEQMIKDVPSARTLFNTEVAAARAFAQTLTPGTWNITSRRASGGYDTKSESKDWFYAVGGYAAWGKGVVTVPPLGAAMRQYSMNFEYKFYDRYNWDAGKAVTIAGITVTDEFMGRFHRQGLAKEYDSVGSYRVSVKWTFGSAPVVTSMAAGGR